MSTDQIGTIPPKFKCEHCGSDEFETQRQLTGHQEKCRARGEEQSTDKEKKKLTPAEKAHPISREDRQPFGSPVSKFGPQPNDGFYYRWFNTNSRSRPTRCLDAERAGYVKVDDTGNGLTVGTNEDGSEIKRVLYRIPKEWHEEDMTKRDEARRAVESQINQGTYERGNAGGEFKSPEHGLYVPPRVNK